MLIFTISLFRRGTTMKLTLTNEEAKELHKEYYDEGVDYCIMQMKKSGPFDFPPFSWQYGLSNIGSWYANISSDGTKFVITKEGLLTADKVKGTWQFSSTDIKKIKLGLFKWTITFNSVITDLGPKLKLRPDNLYGTKNEFRQILEKLT